LEGIQILQDSAVQVVQAVPVEPEVQEELELLVVSLQEQFRSAKRKWRQLTDW
jgi:hypothetical protein